MGYQRLPFKEESFRGRGLVTLELYVNGVLEGAETHIGSNTDVAIEQKKNEVATLADYTSVVASTLAESQKSLDYAIKITNTNLSKNNLSMVLFGTPSNFSQEAGAVAGEAVTARLDKWVKLSKRNILQAPAVVVKNEAGTTTYDEGDDFVIDYWTGRIKALSTGAIVDLAELAVDFSCDLLGGYKIKGLDNTQVEARLRFTGKDLQHSGRSIELLVHKARIKPTKGLDLIGDDHAKLEFEGTIYSTDDGYFDFFVFEQ